MPFDVEQGALADIVHQIALAQEFLGDRDYESFHGDTLRVYAVTRCLEIISEASRRLSDELKTRHPQIAWKEMAGAGNIYRHDYDNVAPRRVWETVQVALPPLLAVVKRELADQAP
jgi:uncharacterized protein with HEPN domain